MIPDGELGNPRDLVGRGG